MKLDNQEGKLTHEMVLDAILSINSPNGHALLSEEDRAVGTEGWVFEGFDHTVKIRATGHEGHYTVLSLEIEQGTPASEATHKVAFIDGIDYLARMLKLRSDDAVLIEALKQANGGKHDV